MEPERNIVPHLKYQKFQEKFGYIPAGDKTDAHIIKSRMLQGLYRNQMVEACYCNYLQEGNSLLNFMGDTQLENDARQELAEIKSRNRLTDEKRLMSNLLSSQPLAFNIFLPLKWDNYAIATKVFQQIFPSLNIASVSSIKMEYVPGDELQPRQISIDNSCFDVWVGYLNTDNESCGLGFEVKYTESFSNTDFRKDDKRKFRYIQAIKLYNDQFLEENTELYLGPKYNQLFRNQLLAEAVLEKGNGIKDCRLVVLYSKGDSKCVKAIGEFGSILQKPENFISLTIERFIESTLENSANNPGLKKLYSEIYNRYCNYELLEPYPKD